MALPRHLYVHVPFCARRCSYCDFSIAVRSRVPVDAYVRALGGELALRFPDPGPWVVDTVYFGGGTPSRLGPEGVAAAVAVVRNRVDLAAGAEVTLEANPDDVSDQAVAAWVGSGINRVSLGIQSFSDAALTWMHRTHDVRGALRAVDTLRRGGIENFSLDLIFALPAGVPRSWRDDLRQALELAPPHVSLYGLTVEPATPLARWVARGATVEAPEERYAEEFMLAHELLTAAGWGHYEVSNFGRAGRHSRHNSSYWTGQPYAGLGPSAHEFDGTRRRWNVAPYAEWMLRISRGEDPIAGSELLTAAERTAEQAYLGLRTSTGLVISPHEQARVEPWVAAGWATVQGDRLTLTAAGWLRLDALAADLTVWRSR